MIVYQLELMSKFCLMCEGECLIISNLVRGNRLKRLSFNQVRSINDQSVTKRKKIVAERKIIARTMRLPPKT